VYDALNALTAAGLVRPIQPASSVVRYESRVSSHTGRDGNQRAAPRGMALPGGRDRRYPPPGGVDTQPQLAGAAGDAGHHVQDSVAEGGDLAAGQLGVVGESDELALGHQIGCRQDDSSQAALESNERHCWTKAKSRSPRPRTLPNRKRRDQLPGQRRGTPRTRVHRHHRPRRLGRRTTLTQHLDAFEAAFTPR